MKIIKKLVIPITTTNDKKQPYKIKLLEIKKDKTFRTLQRYISDTLLDALKIQELILKLVNRENKPNNTRVIKIDKNVMYVGVYKNN